MSKYKQIILINVMSKSVKQKAENVFFKKNKHLYMYQQTTSKNRINLRLILSSKNWKVRYWDLVRLITVMANVMATTSCAQHLNGTIPHHSSHSQRSPASHFFLSVFIFTYVTLPSFSLPQAFSGHLKAKKNKFNLCHNRTQKICHNRTQRTPSQKTNRHDNTK